MALTLASLNQLHKEFWAKEQLYFQRIIEEKPEVLREALEDEAENCKTDWLKYYDSLPERFTMILQSWDTANKSGELNDFSVCTTWGVLGNHYYLLDVVRRRLNYPELKRMVRDQERRFEPHTVLVEDKASGTQLIQDL